MAWITLFKTLHVLSWYRLYESNLEYDLNSSLFFFFVTTRQYPKDHKKDKSKENKMNLILKVKLKHGYFSA